MGSLLQSTLNTRALPVGNLRYIRSDYPGKLTEQEVHWLLQNDITTIVDLREEKETVQSRRKRGIYILPPACNRRRGYACVT